LAAATTLTKALGLWSRAIAPQPQEPAARRRNNASDRGLAATAAAVTTPQRRQKKPAKKRGKRKRNASDEEEEEEDEEEDELSDEEWMDQDETQDEEEQQQQTKTAPAAAASFNGSDGAALFSTKYRLPAHPYQLHQLLGFESDVEPINDEEEKEAQGDGAQERQGASSSDARNGGRKRARHTETVANSAIVVQTAPMRPPMRIRRSAGAVAVSR
jgi:hypothetical protein